MIWQVSGVHPEGAFEEHNEPDYTSQTDYFHTKLENFSGFGCSSSTYRKKFYQTNLQ